MLISCEGKKEQASQELETSGYQSTPADFLRAAENGDVRALELFIQQDMDLDCKDANGWTALHLAAHGKRQESVALLLDAGMDIESPGPDGVTPLMLAAREGNSTMVRYLLKQGAKAELKDRKNRSALILAVEGSHKACVEELAPYSRNQLNTALLYAASQGKHQVIETLTSFGASVYVRHEGGMTPLMLAAQKGHADTVDALLENGANRYAINEHGWTAAQVAAAADQQAIAKLLNQDPDAAELTLGEPSEQEGVAWAAPVVAAADMPGAADPTPPTGQATPTPPTSPAPKRLPFISGKTIASQGAHPDDLGRDLAMLGYTEKPLPIMVEKTHRGEAGGSEAEIRMLYGQHQKIKVREGDTIPTTRFKIVRIRRMLSHSKITDGKPTDVSVVEIEDTRTGQRRKMTSRIPATAAEAWAVLRSQSSGQTYAVRAGQHFRTADGQHYTVSDVRPTQIILSRDDTGEATTIPLSE